jgi:hypothetical protein
MILCYTVRKIKEITGVFMMNNFMIIDMDKKEAVKEFYADNEDDAITYVFALYNPPPANYSLYHTGYSGNGRDINFEMAKPVFLPDEITEDGDYVFDGSVREENT